MYFGAFCSDVDAMEVFGHAFSALLHPDVELVDFHCDLRLVPRVPRGVALGRRDWLDVAHTIGVFPSPVLKSGRLAGVDLWASKSFRGDPPLGGHVRLSVDEPWRLLPTVIELPRGARSQEAEAAASWYREDADFIDLLRRLGASRPGLPVRYGHYLREWTSPVPLLAGGASLQPASSWRDLAFALLTRGGETIERIACLEDEDLTTRVLRAAASDVDVAPGSSLRRDEILAARDLPQPVLLDVLEAASGTDADWRAAEEEARELLAAVERGSPTEEVNVATRHHRRFLIQHAPLRVERLAGGGAILATHPDRPLWPLWESALELVCVRPAAVR